MSWVAESGAGMWDLLSSEAVAIRRRARASVLLARPWRRCPPGSADAAAMPGSSVARTAPHSSAVVPFRWHPVPQGRQHRECGPASPGRHCLDGQYLFPERSETDRRGEAGLGAPARRCGRAGRELRPSWHRNLSASAFLGDEPWSRRCFTWNIDAARRSARGETIPRASLSDGCSLMP